MAPVSSAEARLILGLSARMLLVAVILTTASCAQMPPSALAELPMAAPAQRNQIEIEEPQSPAEQFALLIRWLEGQWNNHHARSSQTLAGDEPNSPLTQTIVRLQSPHAGVAMFRVGSGQGGAERQRVFVFDRGAGDRALEMLVLTPPATQSFNDLEALASLLGPEQASMRPCPVRWRWTDAGFVGLSAADACEVQTSGGALRLVYRFTLSGTRMDIVERAEQLDGSTMPALPEVRHSLIRARAYRGWAMVNVAGPGARASDAEGPWLSANPLNLHDQGQRVVLTDGRGRASDFALELATLTLAEPMAVDMLRLALIDTASGETLAYTWTDPDAPRLGINVGWFQAALERIAERD